MSTGNAQRQIPPVIDEAISTPAFTVRDNRHTRATPASVATTRSTPICLSQLAQLFAQIKVLEFGDCRTFIKSRPAILREDERHFMCQAALAYRAEDKLYARACVHRSLLINKCRKLNSGERDEYLDDLDSRRKSNIKHFFSDLDEAYEHMKSNLDQLAAAGFKLMEELHSQIPNRPQSTPKNNQIPNSRRPSVYSRHGASDVDVLEALPRLSMTEDLDNLEDVPSAERASNTSRHGPTRGSRPSQADSYASVGPGEYSYQGTQGEVEDVPSAVKASNTSRHGPTRGSRPSQADSLASVGPGEYSYQGTQGEVETLDSRYRRQKDPASFFSVGKVFAILWHENVGTQPNRQPGPNVITSTGRFGEMIFSHIRRMIVVRARHGYCWCVGINTYGRRGIAEKRLSAAEAAAHTIAHDSRETATYLPGEEAIVKEPIAIDMNPGHTLEAASRLNFAKVFTVEHNVKVMPLGRVARASLLYLESYWANETSS
jgi:hypothetical protein